MKYVMLKSDKEEFILLSEASEDSPYSQEYLSLLARKKKIFAKKIGRNWYTTRTALRDYLNQQGMTIVVPKDQLNHSYRGKIKPFFSPKQDALQTVIATAANAVTNDSLTDIFKKLNALPVENKPPRFFKTI